MLERGDYACGVQKLREGEPEGLEGPRDLRGLLCRELDQEAVRWHRVPSKAEAAIAGGGEF